MTCKNTGISPIFAGKAKSVFTVKSVEKHSVFIPLFSSSVAMHFLFQNIQTLTGVCSENRYRTVVM